MQRAGATLALAALERGALLETYEAVVSLAGRSLGTRNELREGVLRVLARAGLPQGEALLEQYLLHDPIGPHWSAVPWSLWPQATLLFCRAWSRYFTEKSPETWGGTAVVQAFLKEPQAVRLLRTALQAENAVAWAQLQRELLQAAAAPWLAQAERNALLSELSA